MSSMRLKLQFLRLTGKICGSSALEKVENIQNNVTDRGLTRQCLNSALKTVSREVLFLDRFTGLHNLSVQFHTHT